MNDRGPLEYGKYYHVYNRGINGTNIFYRSDDYLQFLQLYDKYVELVADTYAWCLLGNHFHALVRVKEEKEIGYLYPLNSSRSGDSGRFNGEDDKWRIIPDYKLSEFEQAGGVTLMKPVPHRLFAHLFNSYAKYFNKENDRTGSLFEKNFRRIKVDSKHYLRQLILYIHTNPVKHGFTDNFKTYPWSSYGSVISLQTTNLTRDRVIGWFNDAGNFVTMHGEYKEELSARELFLE